MQITFKSIIETSRFRSRSTDRRLTLHLVMCLSCRYCTPPTDWPSGRVKSPHLAVVGTAVSLRTHASSPPSRLEGSCGRRPVAFRRLRSLIIMMIMMPRPCTAGLDASASARSALLHCAYRDTAPGPHAARDRGRPVKRKVPSGLSLGPPVETRPGAREEAGAPEPVRRTRRAELQASTRRRGWWRGAAAGSRAGGVIIHHLVRLRSGLCGFSSRCRRASSAALRARLHRNARVRVNASAAPVPPGRDLGRERQRRPVPHPAVQRSAGGGNGWADASRPCVVGAWCRGRTQETGLVKP